MAEISCKCKSGCKTGHCLCFKNGQGCSEVCGCINCANPHNQKMSEPASNPEPKTADTTKNKKDEPKSSDAVEQQKDEPKSSDVVEQQKNEPKSSDAVEQQKNEPKSSDAADDQNVDSESSELQKICRWLIYIKRESPFGLNQLMDIGKGKKAAYLRRVQRILGVVEGTITEYCNETKRGKIEVGTRTFTFENACKSDLSKCQGQVNSFSFWPTMSKIPESPAISHLKLSYVRKKGSPEPGYVEAIGKLEQILPQGFVIAIWSTSVKRLFYTVFSGTYPQPEDLGHIVWVEGQLDADQGFIAVKDAERVEFVPPNEAKEISKQQKLTQYLSKNQKKFKKGSLQTLDSIWEQVKNEEVHRTMVNAKLKIVLRELPKMIREVGTHVWIPLKNQAKGATGPLDLPDMPVELLINKKMWGKACKRAHVLLKENGVSAIYIIEGLIGLKSGRLVTIASGIQVVPGKRKEE